MSFAFIFPGQGSQAVGMGKELADAFPAARAVFDEVDAALGEKLSDLIWNGPIETLTLTANAQPALMAVSLAAARAALAPMPNATTMAHAMTPPSTLAHALHRFCVGLFTPARPISSNSTDLDPPR